MPEYLIRKIDAPPPLDAGWDDAPWNHAETLEVANFHEKSSDHRPRTRARLLHSPEGLHVFFHVDDQYVRSVRTEYQSDVCKDACAEFFFQPRPDKGYFNIEINCGGTMLMFYIEDPTTRPEGGFTKQTDVAPEHGRMIRVATSMPPTVEDEITDPVTWTLRYTVPPAVLEPYVGPLGEWSGQTWQANFYKCADDCSHPHWASWADVGQRLNFHQPDKFAPIHFE